MHYLLKYKRTIATTLLLAFVVPVLSLGFGVSSTAQAATAVDPVSDGIVVNQDNINALEAKNDLDFGCSTSSLIGCLAFISYWIFLKPTFELATWMSILFNLSFTKFVVGMGHLVNSMTGVDKAWQTLRDIGNIFLVFLLVYVGIATILGISGYGYKQLLWRIVLAALLVNFSITFAKVVIDVSNLLAIEMYQVFLSKTYGDATATACSNYATSGAELSNTDKNDCNDKGIAAVFWSQLQFTTIFNINNIPASASKRDEQWKMVTAALMGGVMSLVMAFVFGATAFFLVARFVTLIFLIVVSPIALIAWITKVSGSGSKWWHSLLNQSMFAPLILLMWYVAYQVLESMKGKGPSIANGGLASGSMVDISGISLFVTFVLGTGFLIAGLVVAKQFGAYGASAVMSTGKQWSRRGVGLITGTAGGIAGGTIAGTALLGRQTVGRAANRIKDNEALKEGSVSSNFAKRWASRSVRSASGKLAESNFDARGLVTNKKLSSAIGKAGGKGGYNKWAENKQKKEEELHKDVTKYTGNAEDRQELKNKLDAERARNEESSRIAANDRSTHETALRQAKYEHETARTNEEIAAAEAKVKTVQGDLDAAKKLQEEHESKRAAEREAIRIEQEKMYEEKGKERASRNIDRLASESTLYNLPTRKWKKDVASKLRKNQGKSENEQTAEKIKKVLDAMGEDKPKTDTDAAPADSGADTSGQSSN